MSATAPSLPPSRLQRWRQRLDLGSPRRWLVFLLGVTCLGLGVALSVTAGLGVGSWQVFETGLLATTGAPFALIVVVESILALALAWVWLKQPPGPATVLIAFGLGPLIGVLLDRLTTPETLAVAVAEFLVGTVLIGVGVGFYVAAELGPSAQDALFVGLYTRYPIRVAVARFSLDATLVVAGWVLGGQVGAGTVVVTFGLPILVERALFTGRRLAGVAPG